MILKIYFFNYFSLFFLDGYGVLDFFNKFSLDLRMGGFLPKESSPEQQRLPAYFFTNENSNLTTTSEEDDSLDSFPTTQEEQLFVPPFKEPPQFAIPSEVISFPELQKKDTVVTKDDNNHEVYSSLMTPYIPDFQF